MLSPNLFTVKFYLDDGALVLKHLASSCPILSEILSYAASHMGLLPKWSKTQVMPTYDACLDLFRTELARHAPELTEAIFTNAPLFLGVYLGPRGRDLSFNRMIPKLRKATAFVCTRGLGLFPGIVLYNMLTHAQYHYRVQFYQPNKKLLKVDADSLQKLTCGP